MTRHLKLPLTVLGIYSLIGCTAHLNGFEAPTARNKSASIGVLDSFAPYSEFDFLVPKSLPAHYKIVSYSVGRTTEVHSNGFHSDQCLCIVGQDSVSKDHVYILECAANKMEPMIAETLANTKTFPQIGPWPPNNPEGYGSFKGISYYVLSESTLDPAADAGAFARTLIKGTVIKAALHPNTLIFPDHAHRKL